LNPQEDLTLLIITSTNDFNNKKLDKKMKLLANESNKDINLIVNRVINTPIIIIMR